MGSSQAVSETRSKEKDSVRRFVTNTVGFEISRQCPTPVIPRMAVLRFFKRAVDGDDVITLSGGKK